MEDIVRYSIIVIAIIYSLYKIKEIVFSKNYACTSCSNSKSCQKSECEVTELKLNDAQIKQIKEIKLSYKS